MPTYDVTITRTSWSTNTFRVQASNCEEAEQLAHNEAGDLAFTEHAAEYETDNIILVDERKPSQGGIQPS